MWTPFLTKMGVFWVSGTHDLEGVILTQIDQIETNHNDPKGGGFHAVPVGHGNRGVLGLLAQPVRKRTIP